jgi:cytochrome c peroxidase
MKAILKVVATLVAAASLVLASCRQHVGSVDDKIASLKIETLPGVVNPDNNSTSATKQLLGKILFYDPILSGEKDIACVTCHLPDSGYADGIDLSIGVGGRGQGPDRVDYSNGRVPLLGRNSQSIVNTAYNGLISSQQNYDPLLAAMFWDGRKKSLESQCVGPPATFNIMRGNRYSAAATYDSIIVRLKSIPEYQQLFDDAFGTPNSITTDNITKAIAAFERTIVSNDSPYDRYVKGEKAALSNTQKLGLQLFYGKANCATCHSGPMFSDYNYYNLGIAYNPKRIDPDKGFDNKFLFRTPSLRNVALTSPYMHNGILPTLESVVAHYVRGKSDNPDIASVDAKIQSLDLNSEEINAIVEFMGALTDESYDKLAPVRVPSGLKPGGN